MAANRTVKIVGAIVGLGAVYFGLVFLSGSLAARGAQQIQTQGSIPGFGDERALQVKNFEYERGFFDSVATATYELTSAAQQVEEEEPTTFKMRHFITHGPITSSGLGWARVNSELVLDADMASELAKVMGDKKPLEIVTRHGFFGGTAVKIASPAFQYAEGNETIEWGGVQGEFSVGRQVSALHGELVVPSLSIAEKAEGTVVTVKDIRIKTELDRVFDVLYEGTVEAGLGEATYQKTGDQPVKIENLAYVVNLAKDGDFVDVELRFGTGGVNFDGLKLKNLRYDLTFKHVHAPTYAEFAKEVQAMSANMPMEADEDMAASMMSSMSNMFAKLLEKDPEIIIDRIGLAAEQGEFGITGNVKLVDFTAADMELGPLGAMGKLQANFKMFLDEPLLDIELPRSALSAAVDTDDVDPTLADADQDPLEDPVASGPSFLEKLRAQLAGLEQAGFIARNGKRMESNLQIKNGQITANGKPVSGGGM